MGGGSAAAKEVMDDMLVTGSPAPGRKEVWVERCERRIVWVAPTVVEQSRMQRSGGGCWC